MRTAAPRRGGRPRYLTAVAVVTVTVGTVAAAFAGALFGGHVAGGADPQPMRTAVVQAGPAALVLTDGWTPGPPGFRPAGLSEPTGLSRAPADAVLAIQPPQHPSLLPAALVQRAADAPEARRVPRAGAQWRRYDFGSPSYEGRMAVAVAPSTAGVVTLACLLPPEMPTWLGDECLSVAGRVRLTRGRWLPAGREAAARIVLPNALDRLNAVREAGRRMLADAGSRGDRRRDAMKLARSYDTAAETLAPVAAGSAAALPTLMRALADDHRALGRAHARERRKAAIRAGAAIERGERRLGAALDQVGGG